MARITICDLCKNRIKDDESKQGELTLSFYTNIELVPCGNTDCVEDAFCKPCTDQDIPKHQELVGELCQSCTTLLRKTITGDSPLRPPQSLQKKPEQFGAPAVESVSVSPYALLEKAVGPSEEEKSEREPTKELLDDEMVTVKSRFDKRIALQVVNKQKGSCPHHFKTFNDGKVTCGPAPDGMQGELATFKGCGKTLIASEY
jgi:hypothetical protein